jgi:RNA polymerase sigma-70 factor (ECF subfamily)
MTPTKSRVLSSQRVAWVVIVRARPNRPRDAAECSGERPVRCYLDNADPAPAHDSVIVMPERRITPRTLSTGRGESVARLLGTDSAQAEELFNSCYPRLAGWVRRLVDDDETAHEIASEAFTRLLARWTSLDNPQSYLYMIATNLVRDHWRKTERERRAIRAVAASAATDHIPSPAQDVDVRQLIQDLPTRLRSAFLLHYYAGFAVREVAVLLGRPEGTIKADLFQARAKLRASLGGPERD